MIRVRMGRVTGSLIVVSRKSGDVYFIKARTADGRQVKKRLGPVADIKPKDAADELRDFLTDLGRVPGVGDTVAFRYAAEEWLRYVEDDRQRKPSTVRDYRNTTRRHLISRLGERPVAEITSDELEDVRAELVAALSRRTAQKIMVIAHGIFALAKRRGWAPENPVASVEKITVRPPAEFAVLSPDEVQHVARHADELWARTAIFVAAFTGLRLGELRALLWRDVDFANRLIHVRRSHFGAHAMPDGAPKSGQARSVPLIDLAARALDEHSRTGARTGPGDRVFANRLGAAIGDAQVRGALYRAMRAAGINRDRGTGKLFIWHDLRHTFGTLAVRVFPISDVQAYMGHADIQTTMRYVHHVPQHAAADLLGALVESEAGDPGTRPVPGRGYQQVPK